MIEEADKYPDKKLLGLRRGTLAVLAVLAEREGTSVSAICRRAIQREIDTALANAPAIAHAIAIANAGATA